MNKSIYTLWLVAAAGLLAVGNVGCKQTENPAPEVPDMIEGSLAVAIAPSVDQKSSGAVSRLTPSTTTDAGVFETGDKVGLFVQDEHATTFSTINMCYTADASLVFVPTEKVYYKTYYQHGVYGYFPYNAAVNNAKQLTFAIKREQSDPLHRIACDFLTSSTPNIKPQQIDPNAPEIPMTFYHQMTNIVVRIKNGDGSALSTDLTAMPVKVFLVERSTGVNLDLTAFTKDATTGYEACALSLRTKDNLNRLNNRVFLGHNASKDLGTTMFFEGITIPEAVVALDTLIKVQIGPDGQDATRVFAYIPQAGDPIVAAGLTQGKEHIFDLTIKGTQLLTQGGEITEWGTGSSVSQQINGGGTTSSRLIFELTNETSAPNTDKITKCALYLDGREYLGEATYTAAAGADKARLTCSINAGFAFPYWFTQAIFYDATNTPIWQTNVIAPGVVRIKGNPLESTYNKVLGVVDVATKDVTAGL